MKPFITTFTGKKVNPLDLQIEDICIEDIAHHLACINRFVGALKRPVSVGQHSVFVSRLMSGSIWEREALFHDATEAYLGDVSKWVKQSPDMAAYRAAEDQAWHVICKALNLRIEGAVAVKEADTLMVRFEYLKQGHKNRHMFELKTHLKPTKREKGMIQNWSPWSWQKSERVFLEHARMLGYDI